MYKRLFDIIISLFLILITSPIMLIAIVLIRIESKGAAVFTQARLGKNNSEFKVYKLRTMYKDSSIDNLSAPKSGDKRVTKVGKYLRKTSIDELPQLFNVLKGDMSLIGPRAVPKKEINLRLAKLIEGNENEKDKYVEYMKIRNSVKPGISGMAQAYGRSNLTTLEATELDVFYAKNVSVKLDLKIIAKTAYIVLFQKGVN